MANRRKVIEMKRYLPGTKRRYQRCTNCVMDTTDSKIVFDRDGVCDFCNDFKKNILPSWKPMTDDPALEQIGEEIRKAGAGKKYDCIIGLSGGADSSYLCYIAKERMKLRPLAFVVDTGWNLDVANRNIAQIVEALDIDMHVETVDWEEMKDLQVAFFKAQVPYQDLPQDHAIFAALYNYAVKNDIRYVLTGANNATEYLRPPIEWVYQNDLTFIKDVHKRFGERPLKTFPMCGMLRYRIYYPYFKGMKRVAPLNLVPYDKEEIQKFLVRELGWHAYEEKHYEDRFTRWYEGYYLPHKFGYDKRKCYLSNLILTGELTREQALAELERQPYTDDLVREDSAFIAEKLGMTLDGFMHLIEGENRTFEDYKNSFGLIRFGTKVLRALGIEKKMFR